MTDVVVLVLASVEPAGIAKNPVPEIVVFFNIAIVVFRYFLLWSISKDDYSRTAVACPAS
jgi:hypothetical protein